MLNTLNSEAAAPNRDALRHQMRLLRNSFVQSPSAAQAGRSLAQALGSVLTELEPSLLGAYWSMGSEFNAQALWAHDPNALTFTLALPFARKTPVGMHYRRWNGVETPTSLDDCGIPSPTGPPVVPDVVLIPCLAFTRTGWRLGYGGGYFDRWLALHPGVTAIGVAWSVSEIPVEAFDPQPFDQPLTLIVTELGVV